MEVKWQKINHIISKCDNELKRQFSKEEIEATSKYFKEFSTSSIIREIQITTTLDAYYPNQNGYHHKDK